MGHHFDTSDELSWYLVPLVSATLETEGDGLGGPTVYVPDNGSGEALSGVDYVCRARDVGSLETLIGVPHGTSPGANWTAKTVSEAATHFETVMGRPPVAGEIQ